jgi:hypothetical protein
MKYYRSTEDLELENGKSYPKGSVTSEITFNGLPEDVQGSFEEDEETTGTFGSIPKPESLEFPYTNDTGEQTDEETLSEEPLPAPPEANQPS